MKKQREEVIIPNKKNCTENNNMWKILNNTKFVNTGIYGSKCMSATKTANFLLNDPLIDWLELYYRTHHFNINNKILSQEEKKILKANYDKKKEFNSILFSGGNKFEELVVEKLNEKFKKNVITINTDGYIGLNQENFTKTKNAMKQKIPIIVQAVLFNEQNNTCGISDLLVRSDFLNEIFENEILTNEEIKYAKNKYYVIDIKWSMLHFSATSKNILNRDRIKAYKGQLAIYNCALGLMQNFTPDKAFILGKGWKRERTVKKEKQVEGSFYCFNDLGVIDYSSLDKEYIAKTAEAIEWYSNVCSNGHLWTPLNPLNKNMYPNMNNDDIIWSSVKKEIAEYIGEITQVANVGVKEREKLISKNIYSVYDKNCTTENMGMNLTETSERINVILDINRDEQYNILPRKIQNNYNNWQEESPVDFYFDFETTNQQYVNCVIDIENAATITDMIFEIGIGWIENIDGEKKWKFEKFYLDNLTCEEEEIMLEKFFKFILKKSAELDPAKKYYPRLFHWTNAEINNLNSANSRYNNKFACFTNNREIKFIDMYRIFIHEKIGVKGAFNYKLKSVGNALYNLGKIQTKWPNNDITNGRIALLESARYYRNKISSELSDKDREIFNDIIMYNEIDCKMIWEIVNFLRINHNDLDL